MDPCRRLPASRTVGRAECLRLNPAIDPAGVTGGAIWHDYQLESPERFALALLGTAAGAAAANYAPATAFLLRNGTIEGVRARDLHADASFDVRARVVVNAAGPWAWSLLHTAGLARGRPAPVFSLAMNVVLGRAPLSHAVGGVAGGRFLFMVPWRDRSIVGTSHDPYTGAPDDLRVPADRLEAFLRDARTAFPGAAIGARSVRLVHRGLLPAAHAGRGDALLKRSIVHDHRADGAHGLLTVVGVRYTTARATARAAAARVLQLLGLPDRAAPAESPAVRGGDITDLAAYERTEPARWPLPPHTVCRLIAAYGTRYTAVAELAVARPQLADPLSAECAVTGAEIHYAARHEMALHLSDALLRRTGAGAGGHPGAAAVARAAGIMAEALDWSAERTASEISAVNACYALE